MTNKIMSMLSRLAAPFLKPTLVLLASLAVGGAWADITWTGLGGDTNWETAGNWSAYDTTTGMLLDHSGVSDAYEITISSNPTRAGYIWVAANKGATLNSNGSFGLNQTAGDIRIGTWANGKLTINGGTHLINSLVVASGWWNSFAPVGELNVKGGAQVTVGWNALGDTDSDTTKNTHNPSSSGTINVDDSSLSLTSDLLVGRLAYGYLNVNDGGTVTCQGGDGSARWTIVGEQATGKGIININEGGTLAVWHIQKGAGSATLNFNGGTLKTLGNAGNCEYIIGNDGAPATGPTVSINGKGGIFDSNGLDTKVGVAVTGVGTITKKGTGTLTFSGDMSGFIGRVAVASGAGSVTLPATATRARAGDYTAVTTNQDGTFTFAYDSTGSAAVAATVELLDLDFEDEATYQSGWTGKTMSSQCINDGYNSGAGTTRSQGTRANGSKYLNLWSNSNGYRGEVFDVPSASAFPSSYKLEFDWFAVAGFVNNQGASNNGGLALYDTEGNEVMGIRVPCLSANTGTGTVYKGAKVEELGSIKTGRQADPTTNTELWYHITLIGNEEDSLTTLTITDGNSTIKINDVLLGGYFKIGKIYVCIGNRSTYALDGGVDNIIVTTPAVASVDGVNYATFASAVAAAKSTSTITLYSDIELTSSVVLPYGATLDLNVNILYTTDSDVAVTFDDNVHYRNVAEYTEALVQADKDYMQLSFTNRNHNISGGNTRNFLFRNIAQWFKRNLQK